MSNLTLWKLRVFCVSVEPVDAGPCASLRPLLLNSENWANTFGRPCDCFLKVWGLNLVPSDGGNYEGIVVAIIAVAESCACIWGNWVYPVKWPLKYTMELAFACLVVSSYKDFVVEESTLGSVFNRNSFWCHTSRVRNNEETLTSFVWMGLFKNGNANKIMGSDEFIHPFNCLAKQIFPFTCILKHLKRYLSISFMIEIESCLILSATNWFCALCDCNHILLRKLWLEALEKFGPALTDWELVKAQIVYGDVSRAVTGCGSIHECDHIFAILIAWFCHAERNKLTTLHFCLLDPFTSLCDVSLAVCIRKCVTK